MSLSWLLITAGRSGHFSYLSRKWRKGSRLLWIELKAPSVKRRSMHINLLSSQATQTEEVHNSSRVEGTSYAWRTYSCVESLRHFIYLWLHILTVISFKIVFSFARRCQGWQCPNDSFGSRALFPYARTEIFPIIAASKLLLKLALDAWNKCWLLWLDAARMVRDPFSLSW